MSMLPPSIWHDMGGVNTGEHSCQRFPPPAAPIITAIFVVP
jgi:hypothetical protein